MDPANTAATAQTPPPQSGNATQANGNGKKILIVEDEEALSMALNLKLSATGFKVTIAANGQEGVDATEREKFDLILLDLILPVMDGFTVLEKLREKGNKVPVIVLSNLNQQEDIAKVKALGAMDFLVKSNIQLSKILEYLNKVLN
jgi:DNA-binding response OmpR family regulator